MPGSQPRMLHLDMDAFFASVEQVLDPSLKGRPVIVGGRVAMPIAAARRVCPHAVFLRGDFHHYGEASRRVHAILLDFSPAVEVVSVDDFYVDLTGLDRVHGPPFRTAERIRRRIRGETGLSASIGLGRNKLIARLASRGAKPAGVMMILPGHERAFLRPMSVCQLPGVGPRTRQALADFNIRTIGDLAAVPQEALAAVFGAAGQSLWRLAHGEADVRIAPPGPPKSVSRETTFEHETDDRATIHAMLHYLTERAAHQLRGLHMRARRVAVKLRYADMKTTAASRTLTAATDQDAQLYSHAAAIMDRLHTRRLRVRLIGVTLADLRSTTLRQQNFLEPHILAKRRRLYAGLDRIRERFGFGAVIAGPSIRLLQTTPCDEHGFKLRTPSCSR